MRVRLGIGLAICGGMAGRGSSSSFVFASEFADLHGDTFRLDQAAKTHWAALAASGVHPVHARPFAYDAGEEQP